MNKTLLATGITLFALLFTVAAGAQELKDRFFHSIGYTLILDGFRLPSFSDAAFYGNQADQVSGLSIITYLYEPRLNIIDLNENTSIDVHAIPALGFSLNTQGNSHYLGSFSLPLLAGINFGNISTYETRKDVGFGIAFGYEYFNGGLIMIDGEKTPNSKVSVLQPAAQFAVRYWSRSNKAKEISLFFGLGSKNAANLDYSDPLSPPIGVASGSYHFRISWATYLNY